MENPQSRKTEIPAIMLAKPNSGFEKTERNQQEHQLMIV